MSVAEKILIATETTTKGPNRFYNVLAAVFSMYLPRDCSISGAGVEGKMSIPTITHQDMFTQSCNFMYTYLV